MISLLDLLRVRGLPQDAAVKIVRHKEPRYDIARIDASGYFDFYQQVQGKAVFDGCEYIVAFIGTVGREAVFKGVYRVLGRSELRKVKPPRGFPFQAFPHRPAYVYKLTRQLHFDELADRVMLDWGVATRAWVQWLQPPKGRPARDRDVLEIKRPRSGHAFPGYRDVNVSLPVLTEILRNRALYQSWHSALAAVSGVYVIRDDQDGDLYVGSASGGGGLLARWQAYAKDGHHGGNLRLKKLFAGSKTRWERLSISILAVMDLAERPDEVIERENQLKLKLGSRAHGLNAN